MKHAIPDKSALAKLVLRAVALGATEAAHVEAADIKIDEKFARYCREPGCPHYGQGASCPPSVEGPPAFRAWIRDCPDAIVVRLDVPVKILCSDQRHEIMAFLHEVVAGVERAACQEGFVQSRAFAGGSCKELFCSAYPRCRLLNSNEGCRNPDKARPSMSGFGIDVGHLMILADWPEKKLGKITGKDQSLSWVAGVVLVG
jgi:predicted metal-binding protein